MKLRYYADAPVDADHQHTLRLLASIHEEYSIPVEVAQVDPPATTVEPLPRSLDSFPGTVEEGTVEDAWDDFTYNPTLREGIGGAPSDLYTGPEDVVGNVGVVVDGDLVWASQFWGTHHGWGPVDEGKTAIGFLGDVESRGPAAITERIPVDWDPEDRHDDTGGDDAGTTAGDSSASDAPADLKPTREAIRSICTEQSFQRGVGYFEEGRVRDLSVADGAVTATVRGSRDYRTEVDLSADGFAPRCSCPYSYAGECKHVVAVLLAVRDRYDELADDPTTDGVDVAAAVDRADPDDLRTFLVEVLRDDPDLRERFLAATGEDVEKSVADYKQEIDRSFDDAAGRRGLVEYDTRIDFSQYFELASTYRDGGEYARALDVYRALSEAIRENFGRIDDSSGHYGHELERTIRAFADCLDEADFEAGTKRDYLDYLVDQSLTADFAFVRDYYDDAVREVCTTADELAHWRDRLEPHLPGRSPESNSQGRADVDDDTGPDPGDGSSDRADPGSEYVIDPTDERLDVEWFVGDAFDVDSLGDLPLEVEAFVGETLATKLEREHPPPDFEEPADPSPSGGGSTGPDPHHSSRRARAVLSSYVYVLDELDDRERAVSVLDDRSIDSSSLYLRYVDLLADQGDHDQAVAVLEEAIEEFPRSEELRRRAVELYRDRAPEKYREALKRLVVDHGDWDAYDQLRAACSEAEWSSTRHGIVTTLGRLDPHQLVDLYLHEGKRERALSKVLDAEDLDTLGHYQDEVAGVDPDAYFEAYRELLEPYLAGETGRSHYRTVIGYIERMEELDADADLAAFVDRLREKHSNRPAFLDELEKAGF